MAISYVASGAVQQGSNPTIPVPTGYQQGDFLVIFVSTAAIPTTPSGWTVLTSNTGIVIYYKFATGSESSVALTASGAATCSVMSAYRGVSALDTISALASSSTTIISTNTLTATYANEYVVSMYTCASGVSSWTAPTFTTTRINSNGTASFRSLLIVDELQTASGTSTSRTGVSTSSTALNAISFSIIPSGRYWVGGSGTWDTTTTTHWSFSSGGSSGAPVPTASDSVFFDTSSGNPTVTCSGTLTCLNFTVSQGFVFSGTASLYISGSIDTGSNGITWSSVSIIFNATTTGKTLNFGSVGITSITNNVLFDGVGGEWTLLSNASFFLSGSYTTTTTLNNGTLRLNGYTLSTYIFRTGAGTKTIDFGSGIISVASNSSVTIWDTGTNLSGLTVTSTTGYVLTSAGAACTQSIFVGATSEANAISFVLGQNNFYAVTTAFSSGDSLKNLSWGSGTNAVTNVPLTVYGNFYSSSGYVTAGTNAITFAGTGTQTIRPNVDCPVIFNGVGGTFSFDSNSTVGATRTTTLTAGTLSLGTYTLTTGSFVVNGSSTKSINFGTGSIQNNSTGTVTVWDSSAGLTGFSSSGTGGFVVTGTTGTKTINTGAIPEAAAVSFTLQNTAGTVAFTASNTVKNLTLNGTFTLSNIAITIYGNVTVTSVTTLTAGSNAWTFGATSGTKTISNPWGSTWTFPLNFNGAGGTFQLQSAISTSRAVAGVITLTNGTLDLNGYTLTISAATLATFLTAAGTKNITFNGGSIVIATPITTAFNNAAPTGFTTTKGTGVGSISMSGTTAKTFVGGGSTFACALNQGGAGTLTITGANTFNDITSTYVVSTGAATIIFPASTTTTVYAFTGSGASGRLLTINSSTSGTTATLNKLGGGVISSDYLSIKDSTATPTLTWYAGTNSTNVSNNSGWIFTNPPTVGNKASFFFLF